MPVQAAQVHVDINLIDVLRIAAEQDRKRSDQDRGDRRRDDNRGEDDSNRHRGSEGDRRQAGEDHRGDPIERAIAIAGRRGTVRNVIPQGGSVYLVRVITERGRVDIFVDVDSGRIIREE